MTRLSTLFVCVLSACIAHSAPPGPVIPPHAIAASVVDELERASLAEDPDSADSAWSSAHQQFEQGLEPLLRARFAAHEVASVEYGFGRVRSALDAGNADEAVRRLGEQLAIMAAELQPQT